MSESDPAARARREAVDTRAREWLGHLYSGDITEQDRRGFQDWLAEDPEHKRAFQTINGIWTSLDRVRAIEDGLPETSIESTNLVESTNPGKPAAAPTRRLQSWRNAAIAAGVAAIVTFAGLNWRAPREHAHFTTAAGEIRELDLTDGSQLVLRPDTEVVASISDEERNITIERGGAYFDVSRDEDRPFVVSAAGIDVRVHGTAFDVLKGPSSVTVSVTHGRVAVASRNRGGHSVALTGGQQVTVAADGSFGDIAEFDPKRVLGWRDGRFSYFNARLEDIVADINRYRAVKISIEDEALKDLRITTMFRVENTDQMLAGIEATEPVTIVRSSSSIVIKRRDPL